MDELEMGVNEQYANVDFGGEVETVLRRLQGKKHRCSCMHENLMDKFVCYPHEGGLPDKHGKRWWLYWRCPNCGYEWSWHKLERRLDDGRLEN